MEKSYQLNPQQETAVLALSGPARYQHFVSRVTDWALVWGLKDSTGWVFSADDQGNSCFPVWPHADYAAACATGNWAGNQPTSIEVHEFLERWLPGMMQDGVLVAVFPTATMQGVVVSPPQLVQAIKDALSAVE